MELAELADVLPPENDGSNWGELGLESARGSAGPPESAEGSSPIKDLPALFSHQLNGAESPGQEHPVGPPFSPLMHAFRLLYKASLLASADMSVPLARGRTCMPSRIEGNPAPLQIARACSRLEMDKYIQSARRRFCQKGS